MSAIYALACTCHPEDGVRYVGQTVRSLPRRLAEHRRDALRETSGAIVYKWMRRHGTQNIQIQLLELLPDGASQQDLNDAEAFWMRHYRTQTTNLLNTWTPRPPIVAKSS